MTRLITFADEQMTRSAELCASSSLKHNVHESKIYGPQHLPKKMIKSGVRGAGCYWLFKPYIMHKELQTMNEGDVLVYADAGVEIVNNINYIVERCQDLFLFGNMYDHFDWCKFSVLDAMIPHWRHLSSPKQVQASVIVVRNNQRSKELIEEWLLWCNKKGMIDDEGEAVKEHRHDQAILTNIAMINGIDLHWWPAMYNEGKFTYVHDGYEDNYPVIFHHHRKRNSEWQ